MRIATLRTTIVSVPFSGEEVWVYGRRRGITNVLVEVESDDGLTGIGEAVGWPTPEIAITLEPLAHDTRIFRAA